MLLMAALPKIRHPESFHKALVGYWLFPHWSLTPLTYLVPGLEIVVGVGLLVWLSRSAMVVALGLFGAFTLVLSWARWHHLKLTCGCFGRVDSWLHSLPHGLLLHIAATLAITVGLAVLVVLRFRGQPVHGPHPSPRMGAKG